MNIPNLTVLAVALGFAFSAAAASQAMSKPEHKAATKTIEADYKAAKAACEPLKGNAKDVCHAEAKGRERVALAELEAGYKPGDKSRTNLTLAKAKATYAVAREKCDDQAGNAKDVCVKEAEAAHVAAKADAKAHLKTTDANQAAGEKTVKANEVASTKVVAANKDAALDKRDADYAVAKEKCDSLAGTPKDACVTEAKAKFGKS